MSCLQNAFSTLANETRTPSNHTNAAAFAASAQVQPRQMNAFAGEQAMQSVQACHRSTFGGSAAPANAFTGNAQPTNAFAAAGQSGSTVSENAFGGQAHATSFQSSFSSSAPPPDTCHKNAFHAFGSSPQPLWPGHSQIQQGLQRSDNGRGQLAKNRVSQLVGSSASAAWSAGPAVVQTVNAFSRSAVLPTSQAFGTSSRCVSQMWP